MDADIEQIWERTKKDIDVQAIKGTSKQEVLNNLKAELNKITKNQKQIKTLQKYGFEEKLIEKGLLDKQIEMTFKPKPIIKMPVPTLKLPERIAKTKANNKISIKSKGRFRSFKINNVIITKSKWKGKKTIYFYSKKQKKLITWGLINE